MNENLGPKQLPFGPLEAKDWWWMSFAFHPGPSSFLPPPVSEELSQVLVKFVLFFTNFSRFTLGRTQAGLVFADWRPCRCRLRWAAAMWRNFRIFLQIHILGTVGFYLIETCRNTPFLNCNAANYFLIYLFIFFTIPAWLSLKQYFLLCVSKQNIQREMNDNHWRECINMWRYELSKLFNWMAKLL